MAELKIKTYNLNDIFSHGRLRITFMNLSLESSLLYGDRE